MIEYSNDYYDAVFQSCVNEWNRRDGKPVQTYPTFNCINRVVAKYQVFKCPACTAPINSIDQDKCEYCGTKLFFIRGGTND